jgi:hypothetical protein
MIWLLLSIAACTAVVVAGRAHSRWLDKLDDLHARGHLNESWRHSGRIPWFQARPNKIMTVFKQQQPIPTTPLWPFVLVLCCVGVVAAAALALVGWIALALLGY